MILCKSSFFEYFYLSCIINVCRSFTDLLRKDIVFSRLLDCRIQRNRLGLVLIIQCYFSLWYFSNVYEHNASCFSQFVSLCITGLFAPYIVVLAGRWRPMTTGTESLTPFDQFADSSTSLYLYSM